MNDDQHAADGTLNIVHSIICILKAYARVYSKSKITTFKKPKAFGVQTVQTTAILLEIYVGNNLKFVSKEYRKENIPRNHGQRYKWFVVAEMLAYLMANLEEQKSVLNLLQEEEDGKRQVCNTDRVRYVLLFIMNDN
ncbi:hypothetical protein RMATCC62417_10322 [Rhizopus microsporus]|nr:hypothetical protein RMATCC62417_10322 [Rhizopus microsporus]